MSIWVDDVVNATRMGARGAMLLFSELFGSYMPIVHMLHVGETDALKALGLQGDDVAP
jgi:hypothetical protein